MNFLFCRNLRWCELVAVVGNTELSGAEKVSKRVSPPCSQRGGLACGHSAKSQWNFPSDRQHIIVVLSRIASYLTSTHNFHCFSEPAGSTLTSASCILRITGVCSSAIFRPASLLFDRLSQHTLSVFPTTNSNPASGWQKETNVQTVQVGRKPEAQTSCESGSHKTANRFGAFSWHQSRLQR